ncbi:MAG: phosphoribosylformylglycinamidine cyclo-ligase [Candidatus Omnitrophica bacterium]|nr:phosphoribosylformylglycinamidine cyclo-ligase [Candidatus Omnitrophota bacterium]
MPSKVTYKKSGVDIDQANRFIEQIKPMVKKTNRPEVMGGVGGFGALFQLSTKYKKPILVSSTDGVGTKLKCASIAGKYEMLGQDLVGMNVNDIVTCGAEPLFFLDYLAIGKIDIPVMKEIMKGITNACIESVCALIGGETAEMPGVYKKGDFDLAGFAVGIVEADKRIDGSKVKCGDKIIGMASNGFHSNGFSFVRKVFSPSFIKEHAEEILRPTKLYVKPVLELMKKVSVNAAAHITGGGFYDNIPRVLPEKCGALIHAESWKIPAVFDWARKKGSTSFKEMYRTFNMGIGFVVVVPSDEAVKALGYLSKIGIDSWIIGEVTDKTGVEIR